MKDLEREQQEIVKKYLQHRKMLRQTENSMARAALDTKMLQDVNDRIYEVISCFYSFRIILLSYKEVSSGAGCLLLKTQLYNMQLSCLSCFLLPPSDGAVYGMTCSVTHKGAYG